MSERLEGRVAIVTGAARGTGAEIARRFVDEGAAVTLVDVSDALLATAEALGPSATPVVLDVTDELGWTSLISSIEREHGRLDVLVNNAAILHLTRFDDTSVATFEHVMRVNALGTFLGIRTAAPLMARGEGGSIVNISSIDGVYAAPFTSAYSASKFAVRGLTKVAAIEYGHLGIRVNTICPAAGSPEMTGELMGDFVDRISEVDPAAVGTPHPRSPLERHGEMRDVADAAVFLASSESAFMTGTDLLLDGGITAGANIRRRPSS